MTRNNHSIWMLAVVMLLGITFTGCKEDSIEEVGELTDFSTTKSKNEVVEKLLTIPGVSDVSMKLSKDGKDLVYYFCFEQLVDHENASHGTFKQHISLRYVGSDAPVVLHTQGYNMGETPDELRKLDLCAYLNANALEVEHRYFNKSLPEPFTNVYFTYLYTDQAAADLHAIVSAFKQHFFTNNKWVATGASKGGITSTLYAYYSDLNKWKDIDLFVPFCAPFLTGSEESCVDNSIGEYMIKYSGSGYEKGSVYDIGYQRLLRIPKIIAENDTLRTVCNNVFIKSNPSAYEELLQNWRESNEFTTGDFEKDLTAATIYFYYGGLYDKFAYLPYFYWVNYIPDPELAYGDKYTEEGRNALIQFLFMNSTQLYNYISQQQKQTRASKTVVDILNERDKVKSMPYYIQAVRELGVATMSLSTLKGCSYISVEEAEQVARTFDDDVKLGKYANEWDKGKLMNSIREWVKTESSAPIIFVYGYNDPWSGGAIDETNNPYVKRIFNMIGGHDDSFLGTTFTKESSDAIKAAIKEYVGL